MSLKNNRNKGRFEKGTSGNLSGRPPGSRNQSTLLMESLLEGEGEQLIRKTIELAMAGSTRALGYCLERLLPARKEPLVVFDFPPLRGLEDIPQGMMSVMTAVSAGQVTPPEGEALCRILSTLANALNTLDLQRQVEKLEEGVPHDDDKVHNRQRISVATWIAGSPAEPGRHGEGTT